MNHLELRCLSGHIAKVVQFHSGATALGGMSFSAAFRLLYGNELAGGASERVLAHVYPGGSGGGGNEPGVR